MRPQREELIDYLLGELAPGRAEAVGDLLRADAALAAEVRAYAESVSLVRLAAAEGWAARPPLRRILAPALAAAAVLLAAVSIFLVNGGPGGAPRHFEPDLAFGYLRPEEVDSAGGVPAPSRTDVPRLRDGSIEVAALGSERFFPLQPGDEILPDSEINSPADAGARIDLPSGGILFLAPMSTVCVRARGDGETALRLTDGVACTVAGTRPIHLAVEGSDLLLRQASGAALVRRSPSEAVCLRGSLVLDLGAGESFTIPVGEVLPAACARAPQTVPIPDENLALDWYRSMVFAGHFVEDVAWEEPGRSVPLEAPPEVLLYLRVVQPASGSLAVRFGGGARTFDVRGGVPLEIRMPLAALGPGPRLEVRPAGAVREARLFFARPR